MLQSEFSHIRAPDEKVTPKIKQEKVRKKTISLSPDIYNNIIKNNY